MIIGNNCVASGSYTMTDKSPRNAHSLNVSRAEIIGQDDVARSVQNGGSNQAGSLMDNKDGSFKVTGAVTEYTGSFTNNGAYHSDLSTNVLMVLLWV